MPGHCDGRAPIFLCQVEAGVNTLFFPDEGVGTFPDSFRSFPENLVQKNPVSKPVLSKLKKFLTIGYNRLISSQYIRATFLNS